MKLGYTPSWAAEGPTLAKPKKGKEEPPVFYPSFGVEGEPGKKLVEKLEGKLGDTITATVKLKVTGLNKDSRHGSNGNKEDCRVSFEVIELDCPEGSKPEKKEKGAAEAMDEYRSKSKK